MKKFQGLGRSLSKTEQKLIKGGYDELELIGGGYKCCWNNDSTNCSECVPAAEPKCVTGAHAASC